MAGLVPAIHVSPAARRTWVPGTSPGMTSLLSIPADQPKQGGVDHTIESVHLLRAPLISVPLSNSNYGENVRGREGVAMWLFFLVAWFVLLAAIAFLAPQALGYDITHLPAAFIALPVPQRIAAGALLVAAQPQS